jgi:anti-anti-sigma regulatory factor
MLRITENSENSKTTRLRLDGTITAEVFWEIETACAAHTEELGRMILIDMAGVTYVSDEAARRLESLRGEQLRIINCSPFVETMLNLVRAY